MSERRREGTECPKHLVALSMEMCQPCPYFRGAGTYTELCDLEGCENEEHPEVLPTVWDVVCNWPRNGSEIDSPPVRKIEDAEPVPPVFLWVDE